MAIQTVVFPWEPGMTTPTARLTLQSNPSTTFNSVTCIELANAPGIYVATFSSVGTGTYYLTPIENGTPVDGVGIVHDMSDIAATFYESELVPPGEATVDEDAIAQAVVDAIQAIPGFTIEVVSSVDDTGTIQVTQGDAYLAANSRNIAIELTGSLPSIEAVCTLRVFFGGTVTEYTGSRTVNSATSITLKFDLTGVQTAAMPVGTFQYEAEVTYASTSNKWTPSTGKFIVKGQLA
jgi:hypothetical protein